MEMDASFRQALARIVGGLALLLFGLILAIISLLPNAGLIALVAFVVSVVGLILMGNGANEVRGQPPFLP